MNHKDEQLVKEAKKGNEVAFSELIQNHRSKAINWAKAITKDPYLAEDVVQDTMLRSFIHLETLENTDRFIPWLKSMVRNKAIDYIRKNKKWTYLTDEQMDTTPSLGSNPESITLSREWIESFKSLTQSLSKRDREVFEAHFLKQMPPMDIAERFQIKTSNVYNIISRAKVKLQGEAFKRVTEKYVQKATKNYRKKRVILNSPHFHSSYTSLGHVLYEFLQYTNLSDMTLSEVMGFTGQAFRLQMTRDAGLSSSLIYDWGYALNRIATIFGTKAYWVGNPERIPTPDLLTYALHIIHDSIDRGQPAIVWNLTSNEFGLVYGYDIEKRIFTYIDATNSRQEVSYEKLGRTMESPELFVAAFEQVSEKPNDKLALENILTHFNGDEPQVSGYFHGRTSYDIWIDAFLENKIDTIGHAYNLALVTEAREHAVQFFAIIIESYREKNELPKDLVSASECFQKVHQIYCRLYPSFPFGFKKVKLNIKDFSISLLQQAKEAEIQGIKHLKNFLENFLL